MKIYVYVLETETKSVGRQVAEVYGDLEHAQELMRKEYYAYHNHNHDADIEWYSGAGGRWGWYDTCVQVGCYVTRKEVI